MELRPHSALITKHWMVLGTVTVLTALAGLLLVALLPLSPKLEPVEVTAVVWPLTALCVVLLWIIGVPLVILWIKNLRYFIEEDRISIHKGILTKVQQNIPYRAITDFQLCRSLFDRMLGIGSIRIQTAGQSIGATGYEGWMSGLRDWSALHGELRERIKKLHRTSDIAAGTDNPPPPGQTGWGPVLDELRAIRRLLENK